eukprot:1307836-Prymnesium_polylepis.1
MLRYAFRQGPWLVLALPLLTGGTLQVQVDERAQPNGGFGAAEVRWVGAHLTLALGALHDMGLIHRDVKPSARRAARATRERLARALGDSSHPTSQSQPPNIQPPSPPPPTSDLPIPTPDFQLPTSNLQVGGLGGRVVPLLTLPLRSHLSPLPQQPRTARRCASLLTRMHSPPPPRLQPTS